MSAASIPLPDGHPNTVNALRNKRSEIVGDIEIHSREIERLRSELVHLDVVLRLFDPGTDPDDIAGRKRRRRTEYFAKGELSKRVFDALRHNGTTSAQELAASSMAEKQIPPGDRATRRVIAQKFMSALHDLRRRGRVAKIGDGIGVRWKLVPLEPEFI
jgi:hypothetical protein